MLCCWAPPAAEKGGVSSPDIDTNIPKHSQKALFRPKGIALLKEEFLFLLDPFSSFVLYSTDFSTGERDDMKC